MSTLCKDYKPSLSKKDKEDCLKNCVLYIRNHKFNKSTVQNKTKFIGDKNSKGVYIKNIYIILESYNLQ